MRVVAHLEGGSSPCLHEAPVTHSFMYTKLPAPILMGGFVCHLLLLVSSIPSLLDSYKFVFSQ